MGEAAPATGTENLANPRVQRLSSPSSRALSRPSRGVHRPKTSLTDLPETF
jgi:hypothetical protein